SLSFHNIKKLLYLIISDYALEIKRSGFSVYEHVLRLSPFYYVVYGMRDVWLQPDKVFEATFCSGTVIFWSITLFFLLIGSYLHVKFKKNFMEYL
ncbi:ABC transporter permease, partial [Leuconostoc mesenteroides]|nr:ABC transporter permease [Leuconostoc mesenteroides]